MFYENMHCNFIFLAKKAFEPCDVAALAFTRILLSCLLIIDLFDERGLARAHIIWSGQTRCQFPIFPSLEIDLESPRINGLLCIMLIALVGMVLGFWYRVCSITYTILYWLLFLQDRSRWNNHSYLFGLLSLLFCLNDSNRRWSIDSWWCWRKKRHSYVCCLQWQYFILRFQIFLVYFYAALKKTNPDWLAGFSMSHISQHAIFLPFSRWISPVWIDYYLIHLGGFCFDLLVGFLFFLNQQTLSLAFVLCVVFNVINSQLFRIGMFPWIMLAMMPIFYSPDWPVKILEKFRDNHQIKANTGEKCSNLELMNRSKFRLKLIKFFLIIYIVFQLFLPFAFVWLKGFNTWTSGIYGFNWDMMVHNWNHVHTQVKVKLYSNHKTTTRFLNVVDSWSHNHRWAHHADMAKQFAECVERKLRADLNIKRMEIYLDVWASLNGRFAQRIYDPHVNLLEARWSPLKTAEWVFPLFEDSDYWRKKLWINFGTFDQIIRMNLLDQHSKTLFLADGGIREPINDYIDSKFQQPVRIVVFAGTLHLQSTLSNGSHQEYFLSANSLAELEPGSWLSIQSLGANQSYFALLYPPKKNAPTQDEAFNNVNRDILINSLRNLWIGLEYLISIGTFSFNQLI